MGTERKLVLSDPTAAVTVGSLVSPTTDPVVLSHSGD